MRSIVLLTLAIAGLAAAMPTLASSGPESLIHDDAWVQQRVQAWQPTADERKLDEIGWAKDLPEAERLAREISRPVFLFTHDGRIATGRC